MVMLAVIGVVMAGTALIVFFSQGSQIKVTAQVLTKRCGPKWDLATRMTETRCDASVRFTTRTGQVIVTTITDAFASEFTQRGRYDTIELRYDSNDPAQPYKESNYMDPTTFSVLLGFGCAATILTVWGYKRADRIAEKAAARARLAR